MRDLNASKRAPNGDACSALGFPPRSDRPTILAQNLDVPIIKEGNQTLLRIRYPDSDRQLLVACQAGALASLGMNNHRLAVVVNALPQLDWSRAGLPVRFVVRAGLERETLEDALAFLNRITHASGQNYLIGTPTGLQGLECSAHAAVPLSSPNNSGDLFHTNHPLVNPNTAQYERWLKTNPRRSPSTTEARLKTIGEKLSDSERARTVALAQAILATPPVCVRPESNGEIFSAICAVMELGDNPVMRIASGPPDETAFADYTFIKST